MWEVRKQKLYGEDSCPNQLQSQSSPGGLGGATGVEGQRDVSSGMVSCIVFVIHIEYLLLRVMYVLMQVYVLVGVNVKCDNVHSRMDTYTCMCSSARSCGCVADGGDAIAAF